MADEREIFTIGHSTHTIEKFACLLRQHQVTAVVDVRSAPYSRFQPQFNRESLARTLKEEGIDYVFLGNELGARSEDKACYENGRVQYRRLAMTGAFRLGLERVRVESEQHRVALMCAEREPLECHRMLLVGRELAASGMPIVHIHSDGHLETQAEAVARLLKIGGLSERDFFWSQAQLVDEAFAKQEARVAYSEERSARQAGETGL
jgi:uncharacterized protein (DUF488 family)